MLKITNTEFNSMFEELIQLKIIKSPKTFDQLSHYISHNIVNCIEIDYTELKNNQYMLIQHRNEIYFTDSTLPLNFETIILVSNNFLTIFWRKFILHFFSRMM